MKKILLIEDNELNRDMLGRRLERNGYEVIFAADGAEGVDVALAKHPDLILMDMSLPVLDGWEATRKIKDSPSTTTIPVIGLSAHAMQSDYDKAFAAGCDDYDIKPVDFNRLLSKIKSQLEARCPE